MRVPLSCLKEYIDLNIPSEVIAETLTLAGLEVDEIAVSSPQFDGVVVAQVLEVFPHPNANRLKVAKVFDGIQTLQIVCGDPKCAAGMRVALAKIGAHLPDEKGSFSIKKSKIRDVESFGMLCAADELGLAQTSDGILEFGSDMPIGSPLAPFYTDTVFTLSLTPNLGRCMGILGIARELSAFLQIPLKKLDLAHEEDKSFPFITLTIENEELCPHYSCKLVQGVHVSSSPTWLARKLELCGLRSVNNVVDISNYVMLMTGQPLHFFDYDRIADHKLFVSTCQEGAAICTLDGEKRVLSKDTLVIRDQEKILAIAGVMGSEAGEVSKSTQNILIEAAVFSPSSIRKTMKELSLKTEASIRFEKGVDPNALTLALTLSAKLLKSFAGGAPVAGHLEKKGHHTKQHKVISCRPSRVNQILGTHLSLREMVDLLKRLQITIAKEEQDNLECLIPSYRNDLSIEVDLIEEIARLVGFNNLPRRPCMHVSSTMPSTPFFTLENRVRSLLLGEGLQEFLTCDLISPSACDLIEEENGSPSHRICVLQSKSSDYSVLRPSLLPGLLQLVKYNYDRQNTPIYGFEVGRVHFKEKNSYQEHAFAGIILSGASAPYHINPKPRAFDFYDCKGIVENVLAALHLRGVSFQPSHVHTLQPGRQARIYAGEVPIGVIGEIHPNTLVKLDITERVYFAELDLHALMPLLQKKISVKELPLMPSTERDWTLTIAAKTPVESILLSIQEACCPILERAFLLDLFENEKLGTNHKNATFRFVYRAKDRTLDFTTVEQEHAKLMQKVAEKLGNCIV
jgi:phenylalanyl-tRNA synthetase beta chain